VKAIALIVLLWPAVASGEPELSLRLSSWGSLSAGQGAPFDGLIGQIHVAPGVELGERAIFLSLFAGATTKVSSLSEQYWNNAVEPRLTGGARFALPLGALIREAWANLFLGGRYERFVYFTGAQMLDRRVAAFTELMFGLDWRCAGGSRRCTGRGAPLFARCELAIQSDAMGRAVQLTGYVPARARRRPARRRRARADGHAPAQADRSQATSTGTTSSSWPPASAGARR
jgi:hypothetical protein